MSTDHRPPRLRVLAILDTPPLASYPNGWAGRYASLLPALSSKFELTVLYIGQPENEALLSDVVSTVEDYARLIVVAAPRSRLTEASAVGAIARLRHALYSELPAACISHAAPTKRLLRAIRAIPADVALVFSPWLTHLSEHVASRPIGLFLEERWDRTVEVTSRRVPRSLRVLMSAAERRRFSRVYRRAGRHVDFAVTISESERSDFAALIPRAKLEVLVHGIDLDHLQPEPAQTVRYDVITVGYVSLNTDAAFLSEVMQETVRQTGGGGVLRWALVGSKVDPALSRFPGAEFLGFVDDMRPLLRDSKIVVVPSRQGSGVKTTVLEAWALGRTVISTSNGMRGLPGEHNVNALIGESPADVARLIHKALADESLRVRLEHAGRQTVELSGDRRSISEGFAERLDQLRVRSTADQSGREKEYRVVKRSI